MGMVEGATMSMNQLDRILEGLRAFAQGKGTQTEIMDDIHVRITRLIDGPRDLVWKAHHDPELLKRWLLGPDGWKLTVAEVATEAGQKYRYHWEPEDPALGQGFGFDGEALVIDEPRRVVTTEHMTGTDYPSTLNDLMFYEADGATLLSMIIEYPDAQTRDMVLATGMTEGMETSYARLEGVLATV
jgi:uncharacterized protein YndB with AHSA1/START domain